MILHFLHVSDSLYALIQRLEAFSSGIAFMIGNDLEKTHACCKLLPELEVIRKGI